MTQTLRVAYVQLDVKIGEPDTNFERLRAWMERAMAEAGERKPDVLIVPEMWNTGYALDRVTELADRDGQRTKQMMAEFSRRHSVHIVAGSVAVSSEGAEGEGDAVRNTAYVFNREGEVAGQYSKIHLFRLMEEEKYLQPGAEIGLTSLEGFPAAVAICYDIRFPELSRRLALSGAKMLFVPAQWPKPRLHHWRTLLIARAIENQMYVVACNRSGRSGDTEFFGHSLIIDPWGEVLAEGGELEEIGMADIDLSLVDQVRGKIPVFADRRPELYQ